MKRTSPHRPGTLISAVAASRVSSALIQALILLLVARSSPVEVFGQFAALLAVIQFAGITTEAGLETLCSRSIATKDIRRAGSANAIHLALTGVFTLFVAIMITMATLIGALPLHLVILPLYVFGERRLAF